MDSQDNSRRSFVKLAFAASGAVFLLPRLVSAQEKRRAKPAAGGGAGGDLAHPFVVPGAGIAAGLNYVDKHEEIKDPAMKADRSGVKFKDQTCSKCMLYTGVGKKDGIQAGKCTLFGPDQLVKGPSWCNSWAKKA